MSKQSPPTAEKAERLKIIVLDDDRLSSHNFSIQLKFAGENPMVATSENWQQMLNMLAQRNELGNVLAIAIGVVKGESLTDLLLQLHLNQPHLPILLLTPADGAQLSQLPDTLRALLLPLGDKTLSYPVLAAALQTARQFNGHNQPRQQQSRVLSATGTPLFRSLSGDSPTMKEVRQVLLQVAKRPVTVLVTGESGTGKEIVARNLHYHAGRWQKPFVAVNCTAVSAERFAVELFGQEKGFGGNKDGFTGLLEKAEGGTLFLDEVSELPLHVQGLMLRFLEDKSFQRIGGHEQLTADVRVVAGTRHNLQDLIRQGKFREDLYYRLSVVPIELPPLRQRREDIPVLLNEIIASLESKGYESVRFNSSAIQALQQCEWPGNVRELANLVERLGLMQPNAVIGSNDLPPQYRGGASARPVAPVVGVANGDAAAAPADAIVIDAPRAPLTPVIDNLMLPLDDERLKNYLDNFEKQLLEVALDDAAGLIDYAAERVQLDTDGMRMRLQSHGINSAR
jgi:sigma-54 specific flagellar transcriptional regulator A